MSYSTANTAFKDGYARRFEFALGFALVFQTALLLLIPPRTIERLASLPAFDPEPIPPEALEQPRHYRIVDPADAGPPLPAVQLAVDRHVAEIDVSAFLPETDFNPFAEPSAPSGPGGAGPFWALGSAPEPLTQVAPNYPELAREAQAEGTVVVEVSIDRTGRVVKARVVRSNTLRVLETAALEAARQWLFEPARQRGRPVPTRMNIPFSFRLGS